MDDRPAEIRSLTGLRGVAACWVMLYHAAWRGGTTAPVRVLIDHGYLAVDLFFILSGFVLALNHAPAFRRDREAAYAGFLRKRLARTYPLYLVATLVCFALVRAGAFTAGAFIGGPATGWALAANLALIQSWHTGFASIDGPGWSVSAEWGAYLLFPLFCRAALSGPAWRGWAVAALCLLAVAGLSILPDAWAGEAGGRAGPLDLWVGASYAPGLRCLAGFGLGVALFRAAGDGLGHRLGPRAYGHPLLCPALAIALLALLCVRGADVAIVVLFAGLILVLSGGTDRVTRVLGSGPIRFLGTISYALYLVHEPVLAGWREAVARAGLPLDHAATLGCGLASALLLATLCHVLIERPARRLLGGLAFPPVSPARPAAV